MRWTCSKSSWRRADTEKVEHEVDPHEPWTDWAFETFFEHARVGLHLPVYSALYTGQRSVDVIPMPRPQLGANAIELVARKTGKAVYVPIHSEYREILKRLADCACQRSPNVPPMVEASDP